MVLRTVAATSKIKPVASLPEFRSFWFETLNSVHLWKLWLCHICEEPLSFDCNLTMHLFWAAQSLSDCSLALRRTLDGWHSLLLGTLLWFPLKQTRAQHKWILKTTISEWVFEGRHSRAGAAVFIPWITLPSCGEAVLWFTSRHTPKPSFLYTL